ncbi:MAG: hypothetical protein IID41_08795 [Planctomycetes bacterium]|nr:hypothetical protein [Planctomycetota bacterium]
MPTKRPSKKAKSAASKPPGRPSATITEAVTSKRKPGDGMAVKRKVSSGATDGTPGDEGGLPAEKVKKAEDVFDLVRNCDGKPECWLLLGASSHDSTIARQGRPVRLCCARATGLFPMTALERS